MTHTIFVAIFAPLATVGMMLVIMWGMNAAGPRRKGYGQDTREEIHSPEICPEKPFLIDGADGELATRKLGVVGEKPFGDRSIDHGICILTRVDVSNQQQVVQLVNEPALKELARLIECGTNTPVKLMLHPSKRSWPYGG